MLKDMVSYTDIDGNPATKTVFFNLTQYEVEAEIELEEMQDRFQRFMDEVVGPDVDNPTREMTPPEKREMFRMIKSLMKYAYGIKEGKRFTKSQEIWNEFEQTGAFSAYMYQLFLQPDAANRFMAGIWPQGVDKPTPDGSALSVVPDPVVEENDGGYQFMDKLEEYSEEYLLNCPEPEFEAIFRKFSNGRNVPLPLLIAGGKRKQGGGSTE